MLVNTVTRNNIPFDDYDYDANGRVTIHRRFGATWREFDYHTAPGQAGRVAWVEDAHDHRTELLDYHRGLPRELKRPDNVSLHRTVDDNGWISSGTDANGNTTSFEYNDVGWLTKIVPPAGTAPKANTDIDYAFNAEGVEQTITKANLETVVQYDGLLRPTLETSRDTDHPPAITHTRTEYDSQGRPTFQSFPSETAAAPDGVDTQYDALGRLTRTEQTVAPFAVTTTDYLSPGYQVRVTDPRGYVTTTDYLAFGAPAPTGPQNQGRSTPAWKRDLAIKVDAPLGADKFMSHDDFGNVTTETMGPAQTTYEYNSRNLLEKVTDPDNYVSWTWYDVGDLPQVTVDGEGRKTRTVYDNRMGSNPLLSHLVSHQGESKLRWRRIECVRWSKQVFQ